MRLPEQWTGVAGKVGDTHDEVIEIGSAPALPEEGPARILVVDDQRSQRMASGQRREITEGGGRIEVDTGVEGALAVVGSVTRASA